MRNSIGIIGGLGPFAGLNLAQKVLNNTKANTDKDHLPMVLFSYPEKIPSRNEYLFGKSDKNPADEIVKIIERAYLIGVDIIGIACNAAHSPPIFNKIEFLLKINEINVQLINMVEETANYMLNNYKNIKKVGVLSIEGTYHAKTYENYFKKLGIQCISAEEEIVYEMHQCVWNPDYGIKAKPTPVSLSTKNKIIGIIDYFKQKGAQAIVLGCTEFPLIITENSILNIPVLDPNQILARALIFNYDPRKLKSL